MSSGQIQTRRSISVPGIVYDQAKRLSEMDHRSISDIVSEMLRARCAERGIEPLSIEECEAKRRENLVPTRPWLDAPLLQSAVDAYIASGAEDIELSGSDPPPGGSPYRAMNDASHVVITESATPTPPKPKRSHKKKVAQPKVINGSEDRSIVDDVPSDARLAFDPPRMIPTRPKPTADLKPAVMDEVRGGGVTEF